MASVDDQDVQLDLQFLGDTRQPIRLTRYRWGRPHQENGIVTFLSEGVAVCRPILDPKSELQLIPVGHQRYRLPEDVSGPCLVYLRDGPDILTRPLLFTAPADVPPVPNGSLREVLCIKTHAALQEAIADKLEMLGSTPDGNEDLAFLRLTVMNLDGLPPTSLEVLKNLPHHHRTLIRLLLGATDDQTRMAIWSLQGKLPFIWLGMDINCWRSVIDVERGTLEKTLAQVPGTDDFRLQLLINFFRDKFESLVEIEPALAQVFSALDFPIARRKKKLKDAIEGFIKDQRLREVDGTNQPLQAHPLSDRVADLGLVVPSEISGRFSLQDFDTIYAPMLLAACACGIATLDHDIEVPLRAALYDHGAFISEAFPHFFNLYRNSK